MGAGEPDELLGELGRVAAATRGMRPRRWFPPFVLGLGVLGYGVYGLLTIDFGVRVKTLRALAVLQDSYWIVALPLCYTVIAVYFHRRASATGVQVRVRVWLLVGLGLLAAYLAAEFATSTSAASLLPWQLTIRGMAPTLTITLALLGWAWVERSASLLLVGTLVGVAGLATSLYGVAAVLDRLLGLRLPEWTAVANVVPPALVLLAASAIYARQPRP